MKMGMQNAELLVRDWIANGDTLIQEHWEYMEKGRN